MKIEITNAHGIIYPIELAQLLGAYAATVYAVLWDAAKDNDGFVSISNNELGKKSGIPSRSIPNLITKLETADLIKRYLNQGYKTKYHVKNILLDENHPAEQKLPEKEPPRRSERRQPYQKNSVEYVWQASDGGLKPGYKWYGKYKKVALTDEEYNKLSKEYGRSRVSNYIDRMDSFCAGQGRIYSNYAAELEYWIEKDLQKKCGDDVIKKQEMKEIDQYLDLVN